MSEFYDTKMTFAMTVLLVIIIGAGWFIMSNMNQSNSNQGRVINPAPTTAPKGDEAICGKGGDDCPCCTGYLCVYNPGEPSASPSCKTAMQVFGPSGE